MSKITARLLLQKFKTRFQLIADRKEEKSAVPPKLYCIVAFICLLDLTNHHTNITNQAHSNVATRRHAHLIPWNETRPLEWYDFCGKVNDTSGFDAQCFAEVSYAYKFNGPKDFQFAVVADFNKNISWIKKECQSDELLRHERLHFDIAELLAMRMKEVFYNYHYTEDFKAEIQRLFNITKLEYDLMQHQYDMETDHSLNKKKQKEWEAYVSNELARTKMKQQIAMTEAPGTGKTE